MNLGLGKASLGLKVIMMFCVRNHFDLPSIQFNKSNFHDLFFARSLPIAPYKKKLSYWKPAAYVTAGYPTDKDIDELLKVMGHSIGV